MTQNLTNLSVFFISHYQPFAALKSIKTVEHLSVNFHYLTSLLTAKWHLHLHLSLNIYFANIHFTLTFLYSTKWSNCNFNYINLKAKVDQSQKSFLKFTFFPLLLIVSCRPRTSGPNEIEDKLLQVLLAQSYSLLANSGNPVDQVNTFFPLFSCSILLTTITMNWFNKVKNLLSIQCSFAAICFHLNHIIISMLFYLWFLKHLHSTIIPFKYIYQSINTWFDCSLWWSTYVQPTIPISTYINMILSLITIISIFLLNSSRKKEDNFTMFNCSWWKSFKVEFEASKKGENLSSLKLITIRRWKCLIFLFDEFNINFVHYFSIVSLVG